MADLAPVAARLRTILDPYRHAFTFASSWGPDALVRPPGAPSDFFAAVRVGKRYVSFYLMPVYAHPELLEGISPELRRRMQGKSCFNFTSVDEALLGELAELTRVGHERMSADPPGPTRGGRGGP
jgi:hypothetical protein